MLEACLTSCGSSFQILGPYTLNALAAKVDFLTNGMITLSFLLTLRSYYLSSAWQRKFSRYFSACPSRHL